MSRISAIKNGIVAVLKADSAVQSLLGKDVHGEYPVYPSYFLPKKKFPCITVEEITDQAEVSGLKDGYDGTKRYQWQHAIVQVDCWSAKGQAERNDVADAVMKCLLKNSVSDALYVQEPSVTVHDELDVQPSLWRKSLRFKVMYVLEV